MRHQVEKLILLSTLDQVWKDHLLALDHLRSGIGLRAYGQRDPLNEYGREAFDLFSNMLDQLRIDATSKLLADTIAAPTEEEVLAQRRGQKLIENRGDEVPEGDLPEGMVRGKAAAPYAYGKGAQAVAALGFDAKNPATWGKIQRNAPCPCGSGKKFKHCHGTLE
jgi:preprotein translocase subunit SecA